MLYPFCSRCTTVHKSPFWNNKWNVQTYWKTILFYTSTFLFKVCYVSNLPPMSTVQWYNSVSVSHNYLQTSDISVLKINSVSITVLCIIGSFKFLLYFYFGKLFRFSFSFQFLYHFYFSFNFSFYFRFRVYYVEDEINSTNVTTTGCGKISIPQRYLQFLAVACNFKAKCYQHIFIYPMHTSLCVHRIKLSELQWRHPVILTCSKTFIEKCIPEYRAQNRMWISCLDFIAKND